MTRRVDPAQPPRRRGRPPTGGREATLAAALDVISERGASRMTTREVAQRAGVSEGSVFYHFNDRTGLLSAVIEDGIRGLGSLGQGKIQAAGPYEGILHFIVAVEAFLDRALVVMIAAQSEADLRLALAQNMQEKGMGPHRGVEALSEFLREQQQVGAVRADVEVATVAALVYASCFQRASQRLMFPTAPADLMPPPEAIARTVSDMIAA